MAWYNPWKRSVKLDVSLDLPSWEYCNEINPIDPGAGLKQKCRFCVTLTTKASSSPFTCCLLHNEALTTEFEMVRKCPKCWQVTRQHGGDVDVEANYNQGPVYQHLISPPPQPSASQRRKDAATIKKAAKATVKAFVAVYKDLRKAGLSEPLSLHQAEIDTLNNEGAEL
jgi:hypothetical protein